MVNWSVVIPALSADLQDVANRKMSVRNLYRNAVAKGLGPELRPLDRNGADRARKMVREALRRRNLI